MVVRFVRPPFSRLVVAGAVFHGIALLLFILAAANAFGNSTGDYAAITGATGVGTLLHLVLLLINAMVRAEHTYYSEDTRLAFAFDQWYAVSSLAGCGLALAAAIGLWLADSAVIIAGLVAVALVSAPALSVLSHVVPVARDASASMEEGKRGTEATRAAYGMPIQRNAFQQRTGMETGALQLLTQ